MLVCDTGPLVAAALSKDPDHRACADLLTATHLAGQTIVLPGLVVAEVCYLLARQAGAKAEALFLQSMGDGDFVAEELTPTDYHRMAALVEQYADLPLGATDAAVIALAERLKRTRGRNPRSSSLLGRTSQARAAIDSIAVSD